MVLFGVVFFDHTLVVQKQSVHICLLSLPNPLLLYPSWEILKYSYGIGEVRQGMKSNLS